jgi:hypothetical protein
MRTCDKYPRDDGGLAGKSDTVHLLFGRIWGWRQEAKGSERKIDRLNETSSVSSMQWKTGKMRRGRDYLSIECTDRKIAGRVVERPAEVTFGHLHKQMLRQAQR